MKIIEAQIIGLQLQALYRHAEIVSGAYKLRTTQRGVAPEDVEKYRALGILDEESTLSGGIIFRNLTDEEKLADSLSIMRTQIELLNQASQYLSSKE